MDSAVKIPFSQRINFRVIFFAAVVLLIIGYPVYQLLEAQITGGVRSAGGGYLEVDLKALGMFMFDDQTGTLDDVPAKWRQLDGKRLILTGEMYPDTEASDRIHSFQLVYSIAKCCFGGPPKVQERVFCFVPKNGTVPYHYGHAQIKGVLHIKVSKDESGTTRTLYTLDVENAEPLSG